MRDLTLVIALQFTLLGCPALAQQSDSNEPQLKPYVKLPAAEQPPVKPVPSGASPGWEAPATESAAGKNTPLNAGTGGVQASTVSSTSTGIGTSPNVSTSGSSTGANSNSAVSPGASTAHEKEIDAAVRSIMSNAGPDLMRLRTDRKAAKRLAAYHWLDRAAEANPQLIEAITNHKSAAKILARHPRLALIADADHYTCRRITQWKPAARILAKNAQAREVVAFDPQGIYMAIERDKRIIRILSRNPMFDQMIVDNPDLERVIAKYM